MRKIFQTALILLLISCVTVQGQDAPVVDLNQAIEDLGTGTLSFSYLTREGVRGNGHSLEISLGDGDHRCYYHGSWDSEPPLRAGPAQVQLRLVEGRIRGINLAVGSATTPASDRELGLIAPGPAVHFFLDRAPQLDGDLGEDVLLAACIGGQTDVAPGLLAILKNKHHHSDLRSSAMFWAATLASEKVLAPIQDILRNRDEDMELREHAVFALSQVTSPDPLPLLMDIARDGRTPQLQRAAFFALAEHDVPEVHQLFEDILMGR
jgi:hypothetical protein